MHRIAATPGGWNQDAEGVIFIEQTSAPIIILTAADTDIQTLAGAIPHLPTDFPDLRAVNLLQLQQQLSIDTYADKVLSQAKVIILRLLGGRSYWSYGLEVVKEIVEETGAYLFILPGDDRPDPDLMSHSTVSLTNVHQLWRYFTEGGVENWLNALKFVCDIGFKTNYYPALPQVVPRIGFYSYHPREEGRENIALPKLVRYIRCHSREGGNPEKYLLSVPHESEKRYSYNPQVGILFYRAHYLAGNTLPIDALCQALFERNLEAIPVFISSLRDFDIQAEVLTHFTNIQVLLNTTSFSLAKINADNDLEESLTLWKTLNVPVLQVIFSSSTEAQWQESFQGLTPRDVAMNIALPEVDGRIITRAISFKSVATWNEALETDVVIYQPREDRIKFVADLAANWIHLKNTPPADRKIALILANYPNRDGRIANGVGLDTPASCIKILQALKASGYFVEDIPTTGDELIKCLTSGVTNDTEGSHIRQVYQTLSLEEYQQYFTNLPPQVRDEIIERWGSVGNVGSVGSAGSAGSVGSVESEFAISGIQLGNIFIGIQPSRGYDLDPSLNYHAPDLEPTHQYLAYYHWLKTQFQALAFIHLGKHGNLEWLPGKSLSLSNICYPEIALGTIPNLYPFIVNDPGEGAQAKRRSHAVILDHLTPPLTRAELYGDLEKLETLIDEYYEAQNLDPSRLKLISERISQLVTQTNLNQDLGIDNLTLNSLSQFLTLADGYLCELKEAQIRDGLHIFGQCPEGRQLIDLTLAISRSPSLNRLGITQAIAQDFNLDFNPLTTNPTEEFILPEIIPFLPLHLEEKLKNARNHGDIIEILEEYASHLIENLIPPTPLGNLIPPTPPTPLRKRGEKGRESKIQNQGKATEKALNWIEKTLIPALQQTPQEITNLLNGLEGKYIPSGASGAPTRGKPEVLPTGKNFYSVDIRAIPTETAWDVGRKAAELVIERYTQENGEYPQTLAISIWGTSTMRTGGDDVAQVLALLGVKPVWDGLSRRVVDFEILAPSVLGRPRVDVTVRISGFFRDSFPNLIDLLYQAIKSVSSLDEKKEINPLAAQVQSESEFWQNQGLEENQAKLRSGYRIFGSKPGAYGAGLQGLIEAQNWQTDEDLARAYINWSSYAYEQQGIGHAVPEVFAQRLKKLQVILHNQDNREHDLLDSDDYYQFQGGLTVAVRALTGKNPQTYFGDNSIPANPKVRLLKEEIARVYRSRVVNPKWLEGVMRHGYKGAFEMSATVDYLFAYDATARCVEDFMYQGVAEAYLFDEKVQQFVQEKNPWVLRDMAERLLEANQRGLWQEVTGETLEKLREIVYQAEGIVEEINQ